MPTNAMTPEALLERCRNVSAWLRERELPAEQADQCGPYAVSDLLAEVVRALAQPAPAGQETAQGNPLTHELLDLVRLMPDSQVDEILEFVRVLREARAMARAPQREARDTTPTALGQEWVTKVTQSDDDSPSVIGADVAPTPTAEYLPAKPLKN